MSLKEKIPHYLNILESEVSPEHVKIHVRNIFIAMAEFLDSIQNDKIFGTTDVQEGKEIYSGQMTLEIDPLEGDPDSEGAPTSDYVNQDPDLKKK